MSLSARTRKILRDLLASADEKAQSEMAAQSTRRLTKSVDKFQATVNEFLKCAERSNGPLVH